MLRHSSVEREGTPVVRFPYKHVCCKPNAVRYGDNWRVYCVSDLSMFTARFLVPLLDILWKARYSDRERYV